MIIKHKIKDKMLNIIETLILLHLQLQKKRVLIILITSLMMNDDFGYVKRKWY